MIRVERLVKEFTGLRKTGRRFLFVRREKTIVSAVKDISFRIKPGERVAFIGPNGAGKSTTLKMLSGILHPTSGHAEVAGFIPWKSRQKLAYEIGLVFGQRTQLWYHLPVRQSFELLGKIYGLEKKKYLEQMARLDGTFQLGALLEQPVKSLSLGQRMRCEIAASLIHQPKILFLDEPTIGLDVTAKAELRAHLCALGEREGTTIILTSHDTADIEKICRRVILINRGEKLMDLSLEAMRKKYLKRKQLIFATAEEKPAVSLPKNLASITEPFRLVVEMNPEETTVPEVMKKVLKQVTVLDVTVNDRPLEEVIKQLYEEARL
ncbi:MAG: ATP-binding cassette domain-containing protein [Spirochaetia bacterium]|nr:ATP-binding cassette domain-containing protein [Spirochaetia bacterium]